MSDITIKKLTGCSDDCSLQHTYFPSGCGSSTGVCSPPAGTYYTWQQTYLFREDDIITITNFESLDFNMRMPVGGFPIPELRDTCNILVKSEGNEMTVSIAFTMKEEDTSIFTPGGSHGAQSIQTVQEQLDFWINTFQPNSIEDSYLLSVDGITRLGSVRACTITKQSGGPVTYDVRLEFISGNVVAGED